MSLARSIRRSQEGESTCSLPAAPKAPKEKKSIEKDDDDDEPSAPAEPKAKNPLDDLPKSNFNLEDWKRAYSNMDSTRSDAASLKWFYEKYVSCHPVVDIAPDWESYEYKKIDLKNPEDKVFFEGSLAWDLEVNDKKWADGRNVSSKLLFGTSLTELVILKWGEDED
ncbi:hypothetical protein FRC09_004126 [Ceratobasidium sp. 395]|nr:hypothetical protein FRC09_004126 [Ceratobasidium sp. 395]